MTQYATDIPTMKIFGHDMHLVKANNVLGSISDAISDQRKILVGNQNLHSLYLSKRDRGMAEFFRLADIIEVDSMPLILWGKFLGLGTTRANRCTYLDWRAPFWDMAAQNRWRVFLLGSADGVAAKAAEALRAEFPGAEIATHHGFFDKAPDGEENAAVISEINAFAPHVLLVGMGMPLQERWIADNFETVQSAALLSVGGAFDYEAGIQSAAPRFLGQLCLEWLYRLVCDPRRLASRYLVEPWHLAGEARADLLRYLVRPRLKWMSRAVQVQLGDPRPADRLGAHRSGHPNLSA